MATSIFRCFFRLAMLLFPRISAKELFPRKKILKTTSNSQPKNLKKTFSPHGYILTGRGSPIGWFFTSVHRPAKCEDFSNVDQSTQSLPFFSQSNAVLPHLNAMRREARRRTSGKNVREYCVLPTTDAWNRCIYRQESI